MDNEQREQDETAPHHGAKNLTNTGSPVPTASAKPSVSRDTGRSALHSPTRAAANAKHTHTLIITNSLVAGRPDTWTVSGVSGHISRIPRPPRPVSRCMLAGERVAPSYGCGCVLLACAGD